MVDNFSILEELKINKFNNNNQNSIIFNIFYDNEYEYKISKRELETRFCLETILLNFEDNLFTETNNKKDFINKIINKTKIPGDVQLQIRIFYENNEKYGLKKIGNGKNIKYYWTNISINDYIQKIDILYINRKIFTNIDERDEFIKNKKIKCEICGDNERLCIDHWRAFNCYKIDDKKIASLLCERCNNIHHNNDASVFIIKYIDNINIINNWINIEKRVRDAGFLPNEKDIIIQSNNAKYVYEYYKNNNIFIESLKYFYID